MSEPTRAVFNIMRFSIRDGPGIRTTVFFKGCPLDCWWCHNPEGRRSGQETVFWPSRCIRCGACAEVCPTGAVKGEGECLTCGACVDACHSGAREMVGRIMTPSELLDEICKDRVFYDQSGGGVTFSGGEPLIEPDFLEAVLDGCRAEGLHVAVDTCGHVPPDVIRRIAPRVHLFLYDLKLMDPARHREFTGASNELILGNLRALAGDGASVVVRIPVIPGVNDDEGNIQQVAHFLGELGLQDVQLLPYHGSARDKYRRLGKPYRMEDLKPPSASGLARISGLLEKQGLTVQAGG
jgi:pyruvate formate lyase activating enzyme